MVIDFSKDDISSFRAPSEYEDKVLKFLADLYSDSPTISVKSSGSTGSPKIFKVEKQKMLNSARMTCDFLSISEGNEALLCLPVEYISGMMMVVRAIHKKLKLTVTEPKVKLPAYTTNFEFCALTPLQCENNLSLLPQIQKLILGGASVSQILKKKISETLSSKAPSNEVYETYGMSETLSHIALKQLFPLQDDYFEILPGVNIDLDERGCLLISAPQLNEQVVVTNDMVEIINERNFRFLGRADHIINSGGAKINPEALEFITKKFVQEEVVFLGLPDEQLGEKLVMVIETEEDIFLKEDIDKIPFEKRFHYPKEVYFIAKIPRTENGKVLRGELRQIILKRMST